MCRRSLLVFDDLFTILFPRMRVKYADEDTGSVTASNVLLTVWYLVYICVPHVLHPIIPLQEFLSEGVSVSAVPILSQSQSSDTLQPDTTVTGKYSLLAESSQMVDVSLPLLIHNYYYCLLWCTEP